jgi:hypothetical protein
MPRHLALRFGCGDLRENWRIGRSPGLTIACNHAAVPLEIKTLRVRRTWLEKLLLWNCAYETRVSDGLREVIGRGPTREGSEQNALRRWNAEPESDDAKA